MTERATPLTTETAGIDPNETKPVQIAPLHYEAPEADLTDLRERLARTRWADAVREAGWDLGVDITTMRELTGYWQDSFDWRAQEATINRLPNSGPRSTIWTSISCTSAEPDPTRFPLS